MARPKKNGLTAEEAQAKAREHLNSPARDDLIRRAYKDLAALEAERKAIGEDIAELKQKRVKGDLGMKIADFNLGYRLYKLEGDDRRTCLDTIRECFKALGVGDQLDWVAAQEKDGEPEAPWPGGHGGEPAPAH